MPLFIKMLSQNQDGTGAADGAKNFWWTFEFSIEKNKKNKNIENVENDKNIDFDLKSKIEIEFDEIENEIKEERLFTLASLTSSIGSEIIDGGEKIILRADYTSLKTLDELLNDINEILARDDFKDIKITRCYRTNNKNWNTQHLDAFPPLNVGRGLVVMAPWHKNNYRQNRTPLYIYPASAFGTGYHESTRIALELLEDAVKSGDTIIDVGTGTGILFIAALKLGALRAAARDIDPATLDEVRRNMNLNGLNMNSCTLEEGNLLDGVSEKFNILTANVLLAPNIAMLPDVSRVLKLKGCAIFSGMTNMERGAFLSVLSSSGLDVDKELKRGDWWGCRAKIKKKIKKINKK